MNLLMMVEAAASMVDLRNDGGSLLSLDARCSYLDILLASLLIVSLERRAVQHILFYVEVEDKMAGNPRAVFPPTLLPSSINIKDRSKPPAT